MLSVSVIKERIEPICRKYPIERAYLFGSYARGDADENSDVDIRIEGDIKSFFTLGGIYAEFADSLGMEIDLLSQLPNSDEFRTALMNEEVLVYER